jgi:hypothetical protein
MKTTKRKVLSPYIDFKETQYKNPYLKSPTSGGKKVATADGICSQNVKGEPKTDKQIQVSHVSNLFNLALFYSISSGVSAVNFYSMKRVKMIRNKKIQLK